MSEAFDSIYPDFLRTGLGKLNDLDVHRDLISLFAALEHFRMDLHAQETAPGILEVSQRYITGLNLFHTSGFYLVNPVDHGFELSLCCPDKERRSIEKEVQAQIRSGRFAWALRQASSVYFRAGSAESPSRGVFHPLALSNQVLGMFCGLMKQDLAPAHEIAFNLLSMLLGACADALTTQRKTAQLTSQIKTLTGLLPICAWCKKVRDDRGYWDQIENFLQTRSEASFSHGICPECEKKLFV